MLRLASIATVLATVMSVGIMPARSVLADVSQVVIDGAWVRAMPPMVTSTAGYLTLYNRGETAIEVVGASSGSATSVQMHNSMEVDGVVRMQALPKQRVAAGQKIEFKPGGKHLMIMGLVRMPAPGERLELCLQLSTKESVCAKAEVRRAEPADQSTTQHQHH